MHTIGEIAINISLALYFIQYLPQIYHNIHQPHIKNISMTSQIIFIIGIGLDLIYGLGFGYPWQYILVDIIYFIFLGIQQLQIAKAKIYSNWLNIFAFSWIGSILMISIFIYNSGINVQGTAFSSITNISFWTAGTISTAIWIILWIPQIIKNIFQHQANGYAKSFWFIGYTKAICDLTTAIAFNYTWLNIFGSSFSLIIYFLLISQTFYYRNSLIRTS